MYKKFGKLRLYINIFVRVPMINIRTCIKILRHFKPVRYLITGGSSYLIELMLLIFFTNFISMWYIYSNISASIISLLFAYFLNNYWTFGNRKINVKRIFLLFFIHICNLIVSTIFIYVLTSLVGLFYVKSKIIVSCFSSIWNYFISKNVIYK